MTVNLSALAGAGQQFFDNNGNPLTGGKLYTYDAGTTTPQATYTSVSGATAHTNPIILDSAGRVATGEIWVTAGQNYKFVLKTSTDVTIATWDNITGINGTGIATDAANVSYDPPFTGGVVTNVEIKLAETVSVKDFGAIGNGVADDTAAIQAAINSGKYVFIPKGTYKTTGVITSTTSFVGLFGEGVGNSKIVFTREQTTGGEIANSAFVLNTTTGAVFRDFSLEYTGTYYVAGQSYFGNVCGIYAYDCDDTLVENVEITGFNLVGVRFDAVVRDQTNPCKRNKVSQSYLHHNRVAGCSLITQEEFTFIDNRCAYNGDSRDGGTGYGVTTASYNKQVIFANNITDHNYRKGFDVHDCESIVIDGNMSYGDRIYSISVENDTNPMNSVVISNNVVEVDPAFYVSSDDDEPPGTYSFFNAIAVAVNPNDVSAAKASVPNISITGNLIKNIDCDDATHLLSGIVLQHNASSATVIDVSNNQLRGSRLTRGIYVQRVDGDLIFDCVNNSIRTGPIALQAIALFLADTGNTGGLGSANITDNYISAPSCDSNAIYVDNGLTQVVINKNQIEITTLSEIVVNVDTTPNLKLTADGNYISCTSGFSYGQIQYGGNIVQGGQNALTATPMVLPTRIATGNGSSSTVKAVSSLTASTATPIARIGEFPTCGVYFVKWSAYRQASGSSQIQIAGGLLSFVASYAANSAVSISAIDVVSSSIAKFGGSDLTVTWTTDTDVASGFNYRLIATADQDCVLYAEIEQIMSQDQRVVTSFPVL